MKPPRTTLFFCISILSWAHAEETPLPLAGADPAPDSRLEVLRPSVGAFNLEAAFEQAAIEQLNLGYEVAAPTQLESLQQANERLKQRVSELERRLSAVEAQLRGLEE